MQTMEKRTAAPRAAKKAETKETFTLFAPDAQTVELVGNFTDWEANAIPMKRSKDGIWKAIVALEPGTYEYRFKVDGQWQNDPDCPRRTTNPYGEENCIREVA